MDILILICVIVAAIAGFVSVFLLVRLNSGMRRSAERGNAYLRDELLREIRTGNQESAAMSQASLKSLGDVFVSASERTQAVQDKRLAELTENFVKQSENLQKSVTDSIAKFDERFAAFAALNNQSLSDMRRGVEVKITALQEDNAKQLDKMRETVDEKLQKTLEERINKSFAIVSERLEQVYKGLGEMQTLAAGVGDLKKVLSNVKTRGIMGEIQLGAILEEMLSPEQYDTNVVTKKNSANPVEYAVKLPGREGESVYLPIDAKFPADAYNHLIEAYETGDAAAVEQAARQLETVIKSFARDIRDKYINPPDTTDFAIMFLPFEGLYAEVVRRGLVDKLQRDYKISIAGPTTMAALLNSLQMGFRTLAIQKRSGEVWAILGAVKTEFDRFGETLEATQRRLEQTSAELDKLVGVRTRQIKSKLRTVTTLPEEEAALLIDDAAE